MSMEKKSKLYTMGKSARCKNVKHLSSSKDNQSKSINQMCDYLFFGYLHGILLNEILEKRN